MGVANYTYNRSTSGGEIIRELINSTDGQGLHFDGAAGSVAFTPTDVGTKNSFEFIVQASEWPTSGEQYIIDYGPWSVGRFIIANNAGDLKVKFNTAWSDAFSGFKLDDLKPHHLVVTANDLVVTVYVDGNSIGTHTFSGASQIDSCTTATLGSHNGGASSEWFNGTLYRARVWNKTLSSTEVTDAYENATVPFADQYGSQTSLVDAAASVFTSGTYSWAAYGSNTIANVGNTLAITYVDHARGAYNDLRDSKDLTTDLTVGKRYRLTADAKYTGGASGVRLEVNDGTTSYFETLTDSLVNYSFEFVAQSATGGFIRLDAMAASNVVTIDNWYVREIGCVSDYDLAFSNPTQSLMVQDRAGAADGTASATGVVQVTPIEQLNAKAARIGTSAATPADGELMVDSVKVNPAASASGEVTIDSASAYEAKVVFAEGGSNKWAIGNDGDGGDAFVVSAAGNLSTPKLTIDSAGLINVTSGGGSNLPGKIRLSNTAGTVTSGSSLGELEFYSGDLSAGGPYVCASIVGKQETTNPNTGAFSFNVGNNNVEALSISSAGDVGVGTNPDAGNRLHVKEDTANTYLKIETDKVDGIAAVEYVNDAQSFYTRVDGSDNFTVRDGTVGADRLTIAKTTGLVTASNGIVETNGVLKENLLTNSGFDVWSNSTLEDVGSDLCINGDFATDSNWNKGTGWTIGSGVATASSASGNLTSSASVTFVAGKLYELTFTVGGSVSGSLIAQVNGENRATVTSAATYTFVFESPDTSGTIDFIPTSFDGTIDNVTLFEVTPGCASGIVNFDGWERRGGTDTPCWRQHSDGDTEAVTKLGSFYSLKTTSIQDGWNHRWPLQYPIALDANFLARFAGRTVTAGCWVYSTLATPEIRLNIYTGSNNYSTQTVAQNTWTWLEVTATCPDDLTTFQVQFNKSGTTSETYYISQPMLVFGSAIGAGNYSRPMGEIVWFEKRVQSNALNATGFSDVAFTTLNIEADSNGKIPKGAKAVFMFGETGDSSSSTSDTFMRFQADATADRLVYASCAGLANNRFGRETTWQPCDSSGDFQYQLEASGSGTLDAYLNYNGVQLR